MTGSGWEYPEHESHWGDSCADQERGSPIDFRFLYELNKYRNRVTTSALSVRLVINGSSQTLFQENKKSKKNKIGGDEVLVTELVTN